MSGIGSIFNTAGSALSVHKYGIEVTANNISNVDTPGYRRQSPLLQPVDPERVRNFMLGRGVEIDAVTSASDRFVESRLQQQKTSFSFYKEQNTYIKDIEQIFNPNSDSDVSSLLSTFWNSWQDVSNNPSGTAERMVLADNSALLAEGFNRLDSELQSLVDGIDDSLKMGLQEVNLLAADVADLNQEILDAEIGGGTAHALRDVRDTKVDAIAEYMNISSFETENGSLTLMVAGGIDLVRGNSSFDLSVDNDHRVMLEGSGDQQWNVTSGVESGKIGGWLDMRNNVIDGYQNDLDAVAHELIWQVNSQHSQGVGLEKFDAVSGSYAVDNQTATLGASGLSYQENVVAGEFKLWVYDGAGDVIGGGESGFAITIDPATTVDSLAADLSDVDYITAAVVDNTLQITADSGYTFAFSDDTSNVLAALGVNTFFTGDSAANMGINEAVQSGGGFIAAGRIDDVTGSVAQGDNANAMAIADLQFASIPIGNADGMVGMLDTTAENYYHTMLGSIGATSSGIAMNMETGDQMVRQLTDMRDSMSAVSLDEEMINLMAYQSAYTAASKLITTADEMLDTLLSMK